MSKRVSLGRIVGCHGLGGELKVEPWTDDPARFDDLERVFLDDRPEAYPVAAWRPHKEHVLLVLEGVGDRTAAEALRGRVVTIPAEERRPLPAGRFYQSDLEGLAAVDGQGRPVGRVEAFHEGIGATGLIEVALAGGGRVEVPFVDAWVARVELAEGRLVLADHWRDLLEPVDA